jgi:hypothetical protein
MSEVRPWRSILLLLSLSVSGCTGTRIYERANTAAAAGDYSRAVSYDVFAAMGNQLPPTFEQQYRDHLVHYVDGQLTRLGAPTAANADAQAVEVRALMAWARKHDREAVVLPPATARIGELAHVRWPRVTALADGARLDEAVVLGRALVVDAPSDLSERRALADLERMARAGHEGEVVRLASAAAGDERAGAIALHERFARQMGASPTAAGARAEAALARKTGMAPTVESMNAGDCDAAVSRLKSLLPGGGDTPVRFAFRFGRCTAQPTQRSIEAWKTTQVSEVVEQTVHDLVPREECHMASTGSATICDSYGFDGKRRCHEEQTQGQKCSTSMQAVEHTERVRRTREIQTKYRIHELTLEIAYQVTLSADIDGQHHEIESSSTATSGLMRRDDESPSMNEAQSRAIDDLTHSLDGSTRALARFARKKQSERLRREAEAALAADPARAEALYVESSIVDGAPAAELKPAVLKPAGVSAAQLAAAILDKPFEEQDGAKTALVLPQISAAEILEDAHERTDSVLLSAETRAGYAGALIGGVSRYVTSAPGESATGGFVAALVTGAQELGTRYTGGGGSMHLFGNFDGGTSSLDFSMDLGLGLKLGQLYLMPVGGAAVGTSTHASPSDSEFRPNAALRATAFDAVYGGQITFALPYPANLTVNAQLVRTAPIPLDDFKQWTTRFYATIGYHFSRVIDISVFGRYWELDTESVKPLEFFGGNGHDHRLLTIGLGIGGTSEKFLSMLFGGKD